jgi:DNA primase
MEDTEKYLIHAAITADGIVERSDVVGAIFGQTEGLLGDDLDLRDLQQSSKVGRIDVEIDSQNGQSFGTVTIASSLDRVRTAILAASLETITRVGPCRATVEVTDIEDVREAKRREVVERAKELLSNSFDESVMSSTEILEEVKESVRVGEIREYEGLPAGPNVEDSDAVIVVEGRADVLTLLNYGVKNAIAVEGTNVPDAVADLTRERTTTAFFDGDRGGKLVRRELAQVGDVDYVAFAPEDRSVEDLERHEVFAALRDKVPVESLSAEDSLEPSDDATDSPDESSPTSSDESAASSGETVDHETGGGGERTDPRPESPTTESAARTPDVAGSDPERSIDRTPGGDEVAVSNGVSDPESASTDEEFASADEELASADEERPADGSEAVDAAATDGAADAADENASRPRSLRDHVREIIDGGTGTVRLLDEDLAVVDDRPAKEAFDAVADADPAPYAIVVDGEFTQRLLDVAAQRGVDHAVATSAGEFVKRPVGVRLLTADQLANSIAS